MTNQYITTLLTIEHPDLIKPIRLINSKSGSGVNLDGVDYDYYPFDILPLEEEFSIEKDDIFNIGIFYLTGEKVLKCECTIRLLEKIEGNTKISDELKIPFGCIDF